MVRVTSSSCVRVCTPISRRARGLGGEASQQEGSWRRGVGGGELEEGSWRRGGMRRVWPAGGECTRGSRRRC
eukprot:6950315-Prymnesium_polylepis.1